MLRAKLSGRAEVAGGLPRLDLALAAIALVVAVASVIAGRPDEGAVRITLPIAVVEALTLAWRTRAPLAAISVAAAAELAQAILAQAPGSLWSFAIVLVLTYSAATELEEGPAAIGGIVMVAAQCVEERIDNGVDYLFVVIVFGGAWLMGRATREWRSRATTAEQHQHDLARLAVAEERVRIARELHDVVAHGLSVIAVQADAAEAALAHDAALVREPLRAIRVSAREALTDMRQMLHLLRMDDTTVADLVPARGLRDLPALVSSMRSAGLRLTADVDAEDAEVNPGVELAVYRIAQEGLTNVLKHAGAVATDLRVTWSDDAIRLVISSDLGSSTVQMGGEGRGLVGVRERVLAVGGSMQAGPTPAGRFELAVSLPAGGSTA